MIPNIILVGLAQRAEDIYIYNCNYVMVVLNKIFENVSLLATTRPVVVVVCRAYSLRKPDYSDKSLQLIQSCFTFLDTIIIVKMKKYTKSFWKSRMK